MKIVSWNCCNKFREKYQYILEQKADIYVIQECENPDECNDESYKNLFKNGFWNGTLPKKGLGIFSLNPEIQIRKLEWNDKDLNVFLPVQINNNLKLIGVWTYKPYCEVFYDYFQANLDNIDQNCLFIGDFNSNVTQDKHHSKNKNWAACVNMINNKSLVDVYNNLTGEEEGKETRPSFFMYHHLDKPYQLDRCIAGKSCVKTIDILEGRDWVDKSDHVPIIVEL